MFRFIHINKPFAKYFIKRLYQGRISGTFNLVAKILRYAAKSKVWGIGSNPGVSWDMCKWSIVTVFFFFFFFFSSSLKISTYFTMRMIIDRSPAQSLFRGVWSIFNLFRNVEVLMCLALFSTPFKYFLACIAGLRPNKKQVYLRRLHTLLLIGFSLQFCEVFLLTCCQVAHLKIFLLIFREKKKWVENAIKNGKISSSH